ncbi:MAG: GNAT family N-acetyltransferase [Propionibacteriaceae bacterium]|jgi:ribosomal-protein-serine acetyltransferase|nr:GNAT family N-acetyltransferase [Propionibacteriaceae bacterium]
MFEHRIDENLGLRPVTILDAEEVYAVMDRNREHLRRWLPFADIASVEDERAAIAVQAQRWAELRSLMAVLVLDGKIIGSAGLPTINRETKSIEIGYWLDEAHTGKGYVTKTVRVLERMAFEELGAERVHIGASVHNARSRAVAERLGYKLEGIIRQAIVINPDGDVTDEALYGLLKSEWIQREEAAV